MQYFFKIHLGEKLIHARAFTFGEFQKLVAAKETGKLSEVVIEIIHECTGINALELEKCEAEYIFLLLWCHSLNKMKIDATWVCGVCNKEKVYSLDVSRTQIPEVEPYILDLGQIKIKFRQPKFTEDVDIMQMVIACIEYIVIGDQQFNIDDLNAQDFDRVLDMLTTDKVEEVIDELTRNQITLAVPIKCECGESGVYSLSGLSSFLKIL